MLRDAGFTDVLAEDRTEQVLGQWAKPNRTEIADWTDSDIGFANENRNKIWSVFGFMNGKPE